MSSKNQSTAKSRILSDPFDVSPDDIKLYQPQVQLYSEQDGLVQGKVKSPRILISLSRDKLIDEKIGNSDFIVAALKVSQLVKWCRYQNVECVVLRDVSSLLKNAALKRKLAESTGVASVFSTSVLPRVDIRNFLLTPYFDIDEEQRICVLKGATFSLLSTLFPSIRSRAQSAYYSQAIRLGEFPLLAWRAQTVVANIWFTKELVIFFRDHGLETSDEGKLCMQGGEISWCCTGSGLPALYIPSQIPITKTLPPHIPRFEKTVRPLLSSTENAKIIEVQECYFNEFFEAMNSEDCKFTKTSSFSDFLVKQTLQQKQLQVRNIFNRLSDHPIEIFNTDLAVKLYPHQRVAVEWLLRQNSAFIGDDMGLGKTLSVLAALQELLARGEVAKGLVICPNSLCLNWEREVEQWMPGFSAMTVPKSPSKRAKILDEFESDPNQKVIILNYEIVRTHKVHEQLLRIISSYATFLCIDESQRVKNPLSKTFKMLSSLALHAKRRVLLSGTPTPKDITDIWSQIYLLDLGERFGKDYYSWLTSIAELGNDYSAYAVRRFYPKQVEFTQRRVQELLLRRKKERVIALPEKTFIERNIELSGSQLERYEEIRKDLRVRLMSVKGKIFTREVSSILEQYLRAVQIASNPRLVDPTWSGTPAKFSELDFLLEELVGEHERKVVIWTNYVGNTVELAERYKSYGTKILAGSVRPAERQETVRAFQAGPDGPRVIIALPAVAGVGLTLTRAQTAIYLDKTWNAEHWLQSIDRIHRIGQTGTVSVISLHASKVDWLISANLKRKGMAQSALMDGEANIARLPSRDELLAAVIR